MKPSAMPAGTPPAPSISRSVVSNLASNGVTALMSLLFVPVYIHVLGIEAFGLIGFFTSIQVVFALLDLGLGAAANRELARLSVDPEAKDTARQFTRTLEVLYWLTAVLLGLAMALLAPFLATKWVNLQNLSQPEAEQALTLMALAFAARWPFALYAGALTGLERQPLLNRLRVAAEILRSGGAAMVLLFVSPTLSAFLTWQIGISLLASLAAAWTTWKVLPPSVTPPRFDWTQLRRVHRYMIGISGIAVTVAVLTQMDKLILSKLLSLQDFGYYTLAWTVANALTMLIGPVFSAYFPSLSRAAAMGDEDALRSLYHRASQLMAGVILPIGITVAFFSRDVVQLWTQDPSLAENTHVVLSILLLGTIVNGLMNIPYGLLLAYGWTSLPFYANLAAIAVLFPMVVILTNLFGPVGAATAWLTLNAGHMLITQQILHRRILPAEKSHWYLDDTLKPLLIAVAIAGASKLLLDGMTSIQFAIAGTAILLVSAATCIGSLSHLRAGSMAIARRLFA
jgi:O-antigen/teichoic acid export membrane protein